jgi:WD40 repeat protein
VANFTGDVCLTARGSTLAVGDAAGGIELRSLSAATGQSFQGHQQAVLAITSSMDGTLLATAASDGKIAFWRTGLTPDDAQTSVAPPAPRTAAAMVAAWSEKAARSSSPTKSSSAASE